VRTRKAAVYLATVFVLGLALPAWGQETKTLKKIRIGTPSRGMFSLPLIAAQTQGFNQAEGVAAEVILVATSVAIQAMVSGDLDFITPTSSATRAALTGLPVRLVGALMVGNDQSLVVRPDVRRIEDLRGKTLGVSSFKSTPDVALRTVLRKHGLVPDVDVKIIALGGGTSLRLTSLQTGRIDGTMLAVPHNKIAVKMGLKEIFFMKDIVGDRPYSGLATTTRMIQNDPDAIVRVLRAAMRTIGFIKANKEAALALMAKELGIEDKEVANLVYEDSIKMYSDTAIAPDNGMLEEIAAGKEVQGITREIKISDVADWTFAREAYKGLKGSK
jgi:NitT/TauT family transport system substrate-binding protein